MANGALGATLTTFVIAMFAIGLWARSRIGGAEDYLVAGRRLGLPLATATLFATWFGAGTLLTATDEVRAEGLVAMALEPVGAGLCLVVAGLFFAGRLWRMKLMTLPDFFGRRFGARAEIVASLVMVPGYFGWIAAQFVALGGVLEIFWGLPLHHGIWLVAAIGTGYTLLGGMWSVTLTDAVQLVLLLAGLGVLAATVVIELGGGLGAAGFDLMMARLATDVPADHWVLVPSDDPAALVGWLSVIAIATLGNIPGQDLTQRIFAARSARIASAACVVAGIAYIAFGAVPVLTGLAADLFAVAGDGRATLPALAAAVMTPPVATIFVLAIVSAVMSTIDSAILAPASVLANNLLARIWPRRSVVGLARAAIATVAGCALGVAYLGSDAYDLLETAYAVGLVGLFVPLALGLYGRRGGEAAALAAMVAGTGAWATHLALGWESFGGGAFAPFDLPQEIGATAIAWLAYELAAAARRQVVAPVAVGEAQHGPRDVQSR
jgi:solute:Na+ symporter, SSS family